MKLFHFVIELKIFSHKILIWLVNKERIINIVGIWYFSESELCGIITKGYILKFV
jgi:hypothetical protein